jgi:ethanolamine utilization protein EutP (predicted NTPase)
MKERDDQKKGSEVKKKEDIHFDLPDENKQYENLNIKDEDLDQTANFLQRLHLRNHSVALKETIHELYRPDEEIHEKDTDFLSEEDEILFGEIQKAVSEHDITNLRSNLQFISSNISSHQYSFEEIEDYLEGDLETEFADKIQEEAEINSNLAADIQLQREINLAIVEKDILQLRSGLKGIFENESSHNHSVEQLEEYLSNELDEKQREMIDEELRINAGLRKDLAILNEINEASGEKDIMLLRENLTRIKETEIEDDLNQKRGINPFKNQKVLWYAAASVFLILGFNFALRQHSNSAEELYKEYYQPYDINLGVTRSVSVTTDPINQALDKLTQRDYTSALTILSDILRKDPDNAVSNFYSGTIYQIKGDYGKALEYFHKVIQQGDNLFVEQAEWYTALCYLNNKDQANAIRQFRKIVNEKGYYKDKSEELLEKLE